MPDEDGGQPLTTLHSETSQEVEPEEELEELGLQKKLPQSVISVALTRIRNTINGYVNTCASTFWYDATNKATMQALLRRLQQYADAIVGKLDVSLEAAYRQLAARLAALLLIHRAMKTFAETKQMSELTCEGQTLRAFKLLQRYLGHYDRELAPDLMLVREMTKFYQGWADFSLTSKAMEAVAMELVLTLAARLKGEAGLKALRAAKVEAIVGDEEKPDLADDTDKGKKGKGAKKKKEESVAHRWPEIYSEPVAICQSLVASTLQVYLHSQGKDAVQCQDKLEAVVSELSKVCDLWELWAQCVGKDEVSNMTAVLKALLTVWECGRDSEAAKPRVALVREARRDLLSNMRQDSYAGALAKSMACYEAGKMLMTVAQQRAAAGLEDQLALQKFSAACDHMEDKLGSAYEDLQRWVEAEASGFAGCAEAFAYVKHHVGDVAACCRTWSTASMQERQEDLVEQVGNMQELLDCANLVLMMEAEKVLGEKIFSMAGSVAEGLSEQQLQKDTQGCVDSLRGGLAQDVQSLQMNVGDFATTTMEVAHLLRELTGLLRERLGEAFVQQLCQGTEASHLSKVASENFAWVQDACTYVLGWLEVEQGSDRPTDFKAFCKAGVEGKYMRALLGFARVHEKHEMGQALTLRSCDSVVEYVDLQKQLLEGFEAFVMKFGQTTYNKHTTGALDCWGEAILGSGLNLSLPHKKVMQETNVQDLFGQLLPCGVPMTEKLDIMAQDGKPAKREEVFANTKERFALKFFETYVTETESQSLRLTMLQKGAGQTGEACSMSCKDLLEVLHIMCDAKEVAAMMQELKTTLLLPACEEGQELDETMLFDQATEILALLQGALGTLEERCNKQQVLELEKAGWHLPTSLGVLRAWCEGAAVFNGKGLWVLLQQMSHALESKAAKLKACIPSWQMCFVNAVMNEQLAAKICSGGKLGALISQHNSVHELLTRMNAAGRRLAVVPAVNAHEATLESVADALRAMHQAAVASTVLGGLKQLASYRCDKDGWRKAKDFLQDNSRYKDDIPGEFWMSFEEVAAHAAPMEQEELLALEEKKKATKKSGKEAQRQDGAGEQEATSAERRCSPPAATPPPPSQGGGSSGGRALKRRKKAA